MSEQPISHNFWLGQRVRLRGIEPSDAPAFVAWNQDSEAAGYLDFVWPPVSAASEVARVNQDALRHNLKDDSFDWVIATLDGQPVGTLDTNNCLPRNGTFGYGIFVGREHQRKGYASEAIAIVLRYYFQELRYQKCTIIVHSDNAASRGLHEHLGFRLEGTLRRMVYSHGQFLDSLHYGITTDEFAEGLGRRFPPAAPPATDL